MSDHRPWVQTLATFPGIGIGRAKDLADYCGTLSRCIEVLSSGNDGLFNLGIGPRTVALVRVYLGLEEGERMAVEVNGDQR